MEKNIEQLPEIKLVGITARTSNVLEMDPSTAKIGATIYRFDQDGLQAKILNRKTPGKIFAVYTNYESDENGPYTYFLGEEVTFFENIAPGFETLIIPAQAYAKFTSNSGKVQEISIGMWQNIWQMGAAELGGKRTYIADFEIYDERCKDLNNAIIDIYVGIEQCM